MNNIKKYIQEKLIINKNVEHIPAKLDVPYDIIVNGKDLHLDIKISTNDGKDFFMAKYGFGKNNKSTYVGWKGNTLEELEQKIKEWLESHHHVVIYH